MRFRLGLIILLVFACRNASSTRSNSSESQPSDTLPGTTESQGPKIPRIRSGSRVPAANSDGSLLLTNLEQTIETRESSGDNSVESGRPCPARSGLWAKQQPLLPCAGSNLVNIPLDESLSLQWTSLAPDREWGFGKSGWGFNFDLRMSVITRTNEITLQGADGAQLLFVYDGTQGLYFADPQLTSMKFSKSSTGYNAVAQDVSYEFRDIARGKFVLMKVSRGSVSIELERQRTGIITAIHVVNTSNGTNITYSVQMRRSLVSGLNTKTKSIQFSYDPANRLTEVLTIEGDNQVRHNIAYDSVSNIVTGHASSLGEYTLYAYYKTGADYYLKTVADRLNHTQQYNYEKNKISKRSIESQSEYTYDSLERLIQKNVDGVVSRYTYAENGLLQSIEEPLSGRIEYKYTSTNQISEIYQAASDTRITYERDSRGKILSITQTHGPRSVTMSYVYDDSGRLAQTKLNGVAITPQMNFDAKGNVTSVVDGADELRRTLDELGRPVEIVGPNGRKESISYASISSESSGVTKTRVITDSFGFQTTESSSINANGSSISKKFPDGSSLSMTSSKTTSNTALESPGFKREIVKELASTGLSQTVSEKVLINGKVITQEDKTFDRGTSTQSTATSFMTGVNDLFGGSNSKENRLALALDGSSGDSGGTTADGTPVSTGSGGVCPVITALSVGTNSVYGEITSAGGQDAQ